MHPPKPTGASELRMLHLASIFEGTTLLILLLIAVPLKHVGGLDIAVKLMGPIHGFAFLLYTWFAVKVVSVANGSWKDLAQYIALAAVPLGGFFGAAKLVKQATLLDERKIQ